MRIRKTAGWILIAAGALLLAWTTVIWMQGEKKIGALREPMEAKTAELKATRTELTEAGLRYQAYSTSLLSLPDSLRRTVRAQANSEGEKHTRTIWKLEATERDIMLDLKRLHRHRSDALAERKARALPVVAGAAGSLVCGALLLITGRREHEAA